MKLKITESVTLQAVGPESEKEFKKGATVTVGADCTAKEAEVLLACEWAEEMVSAPSPVVNRTEEE